MLTADRAPIALDVRARDGDARMILFGALDCRSQLGAQSLARHGKHVPGALARGDLQIAVRRAEVVEALVLGVDQDGGRRIGLQQRSLR